MKPALDPANPNSPSEDSSATSRPPGERRVIWGGVLAGVGLGGFFDGIVLHQILQWHHLLSNRYPVTTVAGLELNTLADGLFHAGAYLFTLAGLFVLWSAARTRRAGWPTRLLVGSLLVGWGLFNLVEGLVDHHLLGLHHVRPGADQLAWDLGFLAWGALMLVGGWQLVRVGRRLIPKRLERDRSSANR